MILDLFKLDGRVALVTGATRGLGQAMAQGLAQAGADFLAVTSGVWQHPQGPAAGVAAYNAMLDEAVGGQTAE